VFSGGQKWLKRFHCSAHDCPTKLDIFSFVPRRDDTAVDISCKFISRSCVHLVGDVYGQLRGETRVEWSKRLLRPHAMQIEGAKSVSAQRIMTGNMKNLPREHSSERISSNQRTSLRKQKELLPSLQEMASDDTTKDWIRGLSMNPASVILLNEREFAYHGFALTLIELLCRVGEIVETPLR
jgi:hypothetical protein